MENMVNISIGEKLKEIRLDNVLTQKEFSKELGVKQSYYSDLENGKREISTNVIRLLSERFHISSDWLLSGTGNRYIEQKKQNAIFIATERLETAFNEYLNAETALIENGCRESIDDNLTDVLLWTPLHPKDNLSQTGVHRLQLAVQEPYSFLAGILELLLKRKLPPFLQWKGCSIRFEDNTFRFCISGSTSLDELKKGLEDYPEFPNHG